MGDSRKIVKKYSTPHHPWKAERIEEEKGLQKEFGLKNKREIWKTESMLRRIRRQARKTLAARTEQEKKEEEQLLKRLIRLKVVKDDATPDDILALDTKDLLGRRLQTLVYKRGLANTIMHARQLITHGHISIKGRKVTSPGHLVSAEEEDSIGLYNYTPGKAQLKTKIKGES
ncbi:MAG: 30S ribosomal protein S4 [Candidatus Hydrothermarchaeales archaeon]